MDENQKNNPQEDRHDELRHELSQLQPEVAQEDKAEEEAEDLTYIPARRGSAHYTVPLALFIVGFSCMILSTFMPSFRVIPQIIALVLISERALREIYLKAFEIIVKEADPWVIMSAYNMINGHRASENHDLLEGILRDEWHFHGMVTSDWWTRGEHYKEIKAGNDVKMACGFPERVKKAMELGALDRSDLERCAKRVLDLILKID